MPRTLDVEALQAQLRAFACERDWEQFHTPKNLAMALAGEAGELVEEFQWLTPDQSENPTPVQTLRIQDEIADVQIHLLRIADKLGIDLQEAVLGKLAKNAAKYPTELSKGTAEKAGRLGQ